MKINLIDFLDMDYFKNNFSKISQYLETIKDKDEMLDEETYSILEKINKTIDNNIDDIRQKKSFVDFKLDLELLLLKNRTQDNPVYYEYIVKLLDKGIIKETCDISSFDYKNENCKYIMKTILSNIDNIFDFDTNNLNLIKEYIKDDKWFNNYIKPKSIIYATDIINEIEFYLINGLELSVVLEKFNQIFKILKVSSLNTEIVAKLIINLDICKKKANINSDLKDVLKNIEEILDSIYTNKMTKKFFNQELDLDIGHSFLKALDYSDDNLSTFQKKTPIITLDDIASPDLDSAFSIRKSDGVYIFDVFVTDVPSFLGRNRDLSINAYKQGTSFYLKDGRISNVNCDMLPKELAHDYLSMLSKKTSKTFKDSICFNFIINKEGVVELHDICRRKLCVDFNLTKNDAKKILKERKAITLLDKSIKMLSDLTKLVTNTSDKKYLSSLKNKDVNAMIAFPSMLINYYLVQELDFGIYRENGFYTSNPSSDIYLRGSAPLRRYADDINLAILLEQKGLQSFAKDDFRFLENNLEEIIEHLNEQELIEKYIDRNNDLVKKYYLKKRG